jgi:thioredoxin 1
MEQKKTFKDLVSGAKPVLVDFSAEWCGPCKAMAPILQDVVNAVGEKATVIKIDVDQNQALATQLNIQGVPTFVLYKNGEIKWRESGMQTAQTLKSVIENFAE